MQIEPMKKIFKETNYKKDEYKNKIENLQNKIRIKEEQMTKDKSEVIIYFISTLIIMFFFRISLISKLGISTLVTLLFILMIKIKYKTIIAMKQELANLKDEYDKIEIEQDE